MAAHRRLAKLHHPDRLVGHPSDQVEAAVLESKRINGAYAELRIYYGR
ncbi:MAG: J domain-containing protein [Microthrixaceae bacterium]